MYIGDLTICTNPQVYNPKKWMTVLLKLIITFSSVLHRLVITFSPIAFFCVCVLYFNREAMGVEQKRTLAFGKYHNISPSAYLLMLCIA